MMTHNPLKVMTDDLVYYFAPVVNRNRGNDFQYSGGLIKYHTEDNNLNGDISFSASRLKWEIFCKKFDLQVQVQSEKLLPDEDAISEFVERSKQWIFPLMGNIKLNNDRYSLRLQRAPIISYVLHTLQNQGNNYGKPGVIERDALCLTVNKKLDKDIMELHKFRANQLLLIVDRLLEYSKWRRAQPEEEELQDTIQVSIDCSQSRKHDWPKNTIRLACGAVLEPGKKSVSTLSSGNYKARRTENMLITALQHRFIQKCYHTKHLGDWMDRLGHAAVIVDLFEVRHSHATTVVRNGLGCSKGASFILFNYARLNSVLRLFEEQVKEGNYEQLPPLEKIDLSLLEDEPEWALIYGYLLSFPNMIETTLAQLLQGHCAVHLLIKYITSLGRHINRFYRSRQVLISSSKLLPLLHARVHLVKAVLQVLNLSLALLGIRPVNYI